MVKPGSTLNLVGHTAKDWGGPATSMLKLALTPRPGGYLLSISDSITGRISSSHLASITDGWGALFGTGFKTHVMASNVRDGRR